MQASLDENYNEIKEGIYDRCIPELKEMLDDPEFRTRIQQRSKAESLKSDLVESSDILARRGLMFAKIENPRKSFIIGSNPLVRCNSGGSGHLSEETTELWYPIAYDVAVSVGSWEVTERLFKLDETVLSSRFVDRINRQMFLQSNEIAGQSKALIESISRNFVKQSKCH